TAPGGERSDARGQRDRRFARDDLLAALVLGPDLQLDEVDVVF
ncbi:MAG: hypothetical protein RL276_1613, partial [Bacteroidota bacterium]